MAGIDLFLDELAERLAAKLETRLSVAHNGNGGGVPARLLTVRQAAEYLGRSEQAVQHLVSAGKVPTVRADRRVFVDRCDLDRWIEENKQPAG